MRAKRARVHHDAALVVGRAAAVEPAVLFDRIERIGMPKVAAARGLNVVMRIKENGRSAGRRRDVPDHRGHTLDLDDLRLAACVAKDLRGRFGRTSEL